MNSAPLEDKRVWIGGGLAAGLVIVAVSWFAFISPELSSASQLRSQGADTEVSNSVAAATNLKLARQSRDLSSLKAKLVDALDSVPSDSGLPAFTREVTNLAAAQSVGLTSIAVGPVTPVAGTATAPAAGSADGSASGATPITPAVVPAAGEYSISITLLSTGSLSHQIGFIKALQSGPRRVLVTSNQVSVAGGSRLASVDANTSMTTQLTVFSAPTSSDQVAQLKKMLGAGN